MVDLLLMATALIGKRELTDELLQDVLRQLKEVTRNPTLNITVSDKDIEDVKKTLEATIGVSVTSGLALRDGDQEPWLDEWKPKIPWQYWDAYVTELKTSGFGFEVIRVLDEDTHNIIGEFGNPNRKEPWSIQGLVMGDVQSGKTANYTGVINKAADVGYKVIVLLTGVIEELRAQSQARLDSGFIGRDSRDLLEGSRGAERIGVGRYRRQVTPNVLTSVDFDFLTRNAKALGGIALKNIQEPVLVVMKKNKTPLTNLKSFFDSQIDRSSIQLDLPLLILDDEADNASVNARSDDDPATINRLIREIRDKFRRSTYCAYTATPFANVFINPELNDLFPENFVYSLNPPSNYIGPSSIFAEDGRHSYHLVDIEDVEEEIPEKHNKDHKISRLPLSLEQALQVFLLSCVVRDLRMEVLKHRSMLINVSRFTAVQESLALAVKEYLYKLTESIKQYLASDLLWIRYKNLCGLEELWNEHYRDTGLSWDLIRKNMYESIASVKVLTINQKTQETEKLQYSRYKAGRKVVAIGGMTLSRGLTLEGLCVSYFYRNSKAYDTLLQMGRWFGYRTGYEDLCRVWMTLEAQAWFSHISDVVDELRFDIRIMHANRRPPKSFGMRVRSHPETLLVTARNKMRNAKEVDVALSFSAYKAETPFIHSDEIKSATNLQLTARFFSSLAKPSEFKGGRRIWRSVSANRIFEFLNSLAISPMNIPFICSGDSNERPLLNFIRDSDIDTLSEWTVCLPQGSEAGVMEICVEDELGVSQPVKARGRQFEKVPRGSKYLKLNRQRLGEPADESIGMSQEQIHHAETKFRDDRKNEGKVTVSGRAYLEERKVPLLTVHLIRPINPKKVGDLEASEKKRKAIMDANEMRGAPYVGVSISFPKYEESDKTYVTYRLNRIAMRELGFLDDDENEDAD